MRKPIGQVVGIVGVLALGAALYGLHLGNVSASGNAVLSEKRSANAKPEYEDYMRVPMPPGFRVVNTEIDGPVFANEQGMTLYTWPFASMRNGITGDPKNDSVCTDVVTTKTGGLMSPYPPGLILPELDKRKSCAQVWPPAYAAADAKPVGAFTIITRKDGKKQWAYDEHALYTSSLDKKPGDVMGATTRKSGGDGPAARDVATAPSAIPPGFSVASTALGRQLLTDKAYSIYYSDRDGADKSNCDERCARTWAPVIASQAARAQGDWTIFERSPGIRQWAFRKHPLYTNTLDSNQGSLQGSDVPGWHNAYTQKAPPPPQSFTMQDTDIGIVLADGNGKTVYVYNCADDSFDQLNCNQPDSPQVYRLAICGGGKVDRCLRDWPYVTAAANERSASSVWSVLDIDPQTGRIADAGAPGSLRVWAYRGSPVYTFAGDKQPGEITGNGNGEFGGSRNGFRAFFLRDDFFNNAG
jgi:predicted lipoprotein with Yx(FWY)xxD motif